MKTTIDSKSALNWAARFWYLVTALGMCLFVYYIVAFFYSPTLRGEFEAWNANGFLSHGYVPGDTPGNLMFAAHALLAAVLTMGGIIQLIPQLRRHALALHRWNGRVFMLSALLVCVAGLGMNLIRGVDKSGGSWPSAIDLNGLMIIAAGLLAWIMVRRDNIAAHRRWALRTFMLVSGVWFLRVGVSIWILSTAAVFGQPRYVSEFFAVWTWGCFLVPLAMLEMYFLAQDRESPAMRLLVAAVLVVLSIVTAVGVFGAYQVFWGPLL